MELSEDIAKNSVPAGPMSVGRHGRYSIFHDLNTRWLTGPQQMRGSAAKIFFMENSARALGRDQPLDGATASSIASASRRFYSALAAGWRTYLAGISWRHPELPASVLR
jgi:hypothetical protein